MRPTEIDTAIRITPPLHAAGLLAFLGLRAVPGVEEVDGGTYARAVRLARGPAVLRLTPRVSSIRLQATLSHADDAAEARTVARAICDAGADPHDVARVLGRDPLLGPVVAAAPGLRSPGTADGHELLVRAITGQQVSVLGARTTLGRMSATYGGALPAALATDTITTLFPSAERLAAADAATLGMPRARGGAIVGASAACAAGDVVLRRGADSAAAQQALVALAGVGPWTAAYVAMRALGDADAFMPTDLGVRHALERLGADGSPAAATARAASWAPYRSYAVHHLWHTL